MRKALYLSLLSSILAVLALGQSAPVDAVKIGPNVVSVEARHADGTVFYSATVHNLKTNSGVDFISGQISGTASTATAQWVALSTSTSSPSATDTSLPNEITTNGLGRAQGTYAHTAGTSTYTITEVFTATGAQSGIAKVGVLTVVSGGTLVYEILLGTPISMNLGDQLSVQWTVTIS